MADVWLGRFSRWVEKLFNAKGGPVLVDINPSVQTVLSLQPGNEERYLQGWGRYWQLANVAANVGQSGGARLRNPAGSNVVVVVEKLLLENSPATFSFFTVTTGTATTDLTTPGTGFRMDPRINPNSTAILSVQNTTPAALATTVFNVAVNQQGRDLILTTDQEFTLLPGDAIQVVDATVNEQLLTHFMWRERALESSELT